MNFTHTFDINMEIFNNVPMDKIKSMWVDSVLAAVEKNTMPSECPDMKRLHGGLVSLSAFWNDTTFIAVWQGAGSEKLPKELKGKTEDMMQLTMKQWEEEHKEAKQKAMALFNPAAAVNTSGPSDSTRLASLSKKLPGVNHVVEFPCGCKDVILSGEGLTKSSQGTKPRRSRLWSVIQHLNDKHQEWTREKIADWIDELQDKHGLNMEFQVPEQIKDEDCD